ncbi:MAG: AAA family ATPase, partial [Candidatus Rokubacteria bacterium]|nr:AAA family ATPase [Candidatus Rokubacteria bacterium]
ELLAARAPEEARGILDPALERMLEAVHRDEVTLNQVMGVGFLALFGAPLAHEDHAVRACYAALRMQETVGWYAEELRRTQGLDVQIRVGLNSGAVVVRSIGSDLHMDYTAVGQTTHLAARMEQLARPGTTLMTASTLWLAEGYVEVRPLGPVPVKGLAEAIQVYEVERAGPARSRLQAAAARGLSPFVGRDRELGTLRQSLDRAQAGHGQIVAVVGEPGVGKSRLFREFTRSHRVRGWLILEGSAVSYARLTSYDAVVELLRGYFQVGQRDDARTIREKVTGKLLTLDETLKAALPAFLALLDVPVEDSEWQTPDPALRRQRTLDAVTRLLLRESQVQPLVLVFENLHWIDGETQACLDHLVEALPAARILILANYRPEYAHAWGARSCYTQLRLDPLPPVTAGALLRTLLGGDASLEPVTRFVIERTEGNPFFIEECVRMLIETQVLAGEHGAHRLAGELPSVAVPATVQAVIASRIDRLAPEEKRLLQAAAAIGKDVPLALLRAVAELPEEALDESLARLQAGEFLYETGGYPDPEYTFNHTLTHDVAYGTLLQDRRRALHVEILRALERLHPDRRTELAEVLAEHAFRGEAWNEAVAHLRRAGAKATARSANVEAVAYLERALAALGKLAESEEVRAQGIDVRLELRPPLLQLGHLQRVLAVSQQAENIAKLIGDQARLARVYSYLINYHYLKGEPDMAIAYGERCLTIGEAGEDAALQALARGYMGYSYHAQGRYREAEAVLARNLEKLEAMRAAGAAEAQTTIPYVSSSGWLAFTLAELGDFDQARTYADMAERAAEAARHAYAQAIAWTLGGLVALTRGHLDRALHLLEKSLDTCQSAELTVWQPIPSSLLGLTEVLLGRHDEGLRLLEDGVARSEAVGVKAYLALWTVQLGEGLVAAGQASRALAVAETALNLAIAHKERGHQARALRLLGEIALVGDPPDLPRAERDLDQAMALAAELGMRPLVGRIEFGLGQLHLKKGSRAQAEDHLIAALALFRALDMRFFAAQTMAALKRLGHIFVVAHQNLGLYEFLKERFSGDREVTVVLDRRGDDRRRSRQPAAAERRRGERRLPPSFDSALRVRGLVVLPRAGG